MAPKQSRSSDLGAIKTAAPAEAPVHVQKLDKLGRAYATGKRKDAVARVWIKPGTGKITVNEQGLHEVLRPSRAADDPEAAADRRQPR